MSGDGEEEQSLNFHNDFPIFVVSIFLLIKEDFLLIRDGMDGVCIQQKGGPFSLNTARHNLNESILFHVILVGKLLKRPGRSRKFFELSSCFVFSFIP